MKPCQSWLNIVPKATSSTFCSHCQTLTKTTIAATAPCANVSARPNINPVARALLGGYNFVGNGVVASQPAQYFVSRRVVKAIISMHLSLLPFGGQALQTGVLQHQQVCLQAIR